MFNSTPCANTHEITLQNNKKDSTKHLITPCTHERRGKHHTNVTYYSFLKVYTLMYITCMVASHLISGKHS